MYNEVENIYATKHSVRNLYDVIKELKDTVKSLMIINGIMCVLICVVMIYLINVL